MSSSANNIIYVAYRLTLLSANAKNPGVFRPPGTILYSFICYSSNARQSGAIRRNPKALLSQRISLMFVTVFICFFGFLTPNIDCLLNILYYTTFILQLQELFLNRFNIIFPLYMIFSKKQELNLNLNLNPRLTNFLLVL